MKAKQLQHLHTTVAALKDQLQSGRKVVKYIRNVKNQDTLQKPRYQPIATDIGKEKSQQISKQLSMNSLDYTNQLIFETITPTTSTPMLMGKQLRTQPQRLAKPKTVFDMTQMKSFMEQFEAEKTTRKKSKYETIINRLKMRNTLIQPKVEEEEEGGSTPEINIANVLKLMTPSYEIYRQQLDSLLDSKASRVTTKHSVIVPKMIKKLGLVTLKQRKEQLIQRIHQQAMEDVDPKQGYFSQHLKHEQIVPNIRRSFQAPLNRRTVIIKTEPIEPRASKFNPYKTSLEAMKSQKDMFDNYLQNSDLSAQYFFPTTHKQLLTTKCRVKDFYERVCQYTQESQCEQLESQQQVFEEMGSIQRNISQWQRFMLSQSEKMELNLLKDIRDQVILNKRLYTQ